MNQPALLLMALVFAAFNLAGQAGGIGGTTPTAGNGGTSAQANPGSGGGLRGSDFSRTMYISGKVLMEDGSSVPEDTIIERLCSGMAKTVAFTDSKGHFSFQWGDRSMIITDASDAGSGPSGHGGGGGFGGAQTAGGSSALATDPFGNRMMNCELRASLAGYKSSTIDLFNRRGADSPEIGAILLRRIGGVDGVSISLTSLRAPKEARKAYQRGLQSMLKNKRDEAVRDFEKAVALYPNYADAWVNLGKMRIQGQSIDSARQALRRAVESDPKLVTPYVELGLLAATDTNWQDSARYLDRAVELDPVDYPQVWYADAVANYNLRKYDAAEKSARAALKLDPRHVNPRSGYLLGLVLAEKRDYAGASEELRTYIKLAPNAPDMPQAKTRLGELEKLTGGSQ